MCVGSLTDNKLVCEIMGGSEVLLERWYKDVLSSPCTPRGGPMNGCQVSGLDLAVEAQGTWSAQLPKRKVGQESWAEKLGKKKVGQNLEPFQTF